MLLWVEIILVYLKIFIIKICVSNLKKLDSSELDKSENLYGGTNEKSIHSDTGMINAIKN